MMFNFLLSLCATYFSSVSRSSLKSSYFEYKNQNMLLSNYILLVLTRCVEFKSKLSFDFCINSTKSRIIILLNFFLCEFVDTYKSRQHSTINLHIPHHAGPSVINSGPVLFHLCPLPHSELCIILQQSLGNPSFDI